jgi:gas vesicle protein GvpL/GvpF
VIELYAITADPAPPLPEAGSLRSVTFDGLAAVYAPAGDGEVTAEALWRHEEIVETLMADRDLLPVRYGTRLEDPAAAEAVLRERRDELGAALERVRGAVEVSVRAVTPCAPEGPLPDASMSGAEYLRAKVGAESAHDEAVRDLHEPLAGLARHAVTRPPRPSEALRAAYLVDREAVERFTMAVAGLERAHPEHRVLCTGPWPPYSFTGS